MKTTAIALITVTMTAMSHAAVYSITNSIGDSTVGITQADGKPAGSATVKGFNTTQGFGMFGYFKTLSDPQIMLASTVTDLVADFSSFNTNASAFGATTLGNNGTITMGNADLDVGVAGAGAAFNGKSLYMVFANVANSTLLTQTTQFLILKHLTETFDPTDDVPAVKNVTFSAADTALLVGQVGTYSFKTRTSDTTAGPAWNTAVLVPESSTALLGALGAIGLLRRRR